MKNKIFQQKLEIIQNLTAILIGTTSSLIAILIIVSTQQWLEAIALLIVAIIFIPITKIPEWAKTFLAIFMLFMFFS